jgi:hypothetical protein
MAYQKKRNAIVGYLKVGVSYLHGELILTDRAFSTPVFRHDRRSLIGSAEARGRPWQRQPQPSNRGKLAAGSSAFAQLQPDQTAAVLPKYARLSARAELTTKSRDRNRRSFPTAVLQKHKQKEESRAPL